MGWRCDANSMRLQLGVCGIYDRKRTCHRTHWSLQLPLTTRGVAFVAMTASYAEDEKDSACTISSECVDLRGPKAISDGGIGNEVSSIADYAVSHSTCRWGAACVHVGHETAQRHVVARVAD